VVLRSILLFLAAAVCEIGGAWLVWQGIRENKGWLWIGGGLVALGVYVIGALLCLAGVAVIMYAPRTG